MVHSQALGQESWGMRLGGCSCAAYRLKVEKSSSHGLHKCIQNKE